MVWGTNPHHTPRRMYFHAYLNVLTTRTCEDARRHRQEIMCGSVLYSPDRSNPHTVEYDPFIKSQLAARNYLYGLVWCKFGHVTPQNLESTKPSCSTEWTDHVPDVGVPHYQNSPPNHPLLRPSCTTRILQRPGESGSMDILYNSSGSGAHEQSPSSASLRLRLPLSLSLPISP